MIDTLRQDLRYATRSLGRAPGFAAAAIVTLALGIGANAAMFTLLDAAMFKPLNVPAPADLVTLFEQPREGNPDIAGGTGRYLRFSYPHFERMRDALGTHGSLVAMTRTPTIGRHRSAMVRAGSHRLAQHHRSHSGTQCGAGEQRARSRQISPRLVFRSSPAVSSPNAIARAAPASRS